MSYLQCASCSYTLHSKQDPDLQYLLVGVNLICSHDIYLVLTSFLSYFTTLHVFLVFPFVPYIAILTHITEQMLPVYHRNCFNPLTPNVCLYAGWLYSDWLHSCEQTMLTTATVTWSEYLLQCCADTGSCLCHTFHTSWLAAWKLTTTLQISTLFFIS